MPLRMNMQSRRKHKSKLDICVTFVVYACGKSILWGGHMKKILLIDDSDIYI